MLSALTLRSASHLHDAHDTPHVVRDDVAARCSEPVPLMNTHSHSQQLGRSVASHGRSPVNAGMHEGNLRDHQSTAMPERRRPGHTRRRSMHVVFGGFFVPLTNHAPGMSVACMCTPVDTGRSHRQVKALLAPRLLASRLRSTCHSHPRRIRHDHPRSCTWRRTRSRLVTHAAKQSFWLHLHMHLEHCASPKRASAAAPQCMPQGHVGAHLGQHGLIAARAVQGCSSQTTRLSAGGGPVSYAVV